MTGVQTCALPICFPVTIIEIEDEILSNDEDGEVIETTTKFEFNLGFAKVSRSIKKIKK